MWTLTEVQDKMDKGEVKSVVTDGLLALQWMDKRKVTVLSTIHDRSMVSKHRLAPVGVGEIMKPGIVAEY